MAKGFGNLKPQVGRGENVYVDSIVDVYSFKEHDKEWTAFRFLPTDILSVRTHWADIVSKEGKEVSVGKVCLAWDPVTEEMMEDRQCPYCDADMRTSTTYYANAIVRDLQQDQPAKIRMTESEEKSGLKDKKSKSWTPVRVVKLPSSAADKVQKLQALNKRLNKKTGKEKSYPVSDERFGMDVQIMFDSKQSASNMYSVSKDDKSSLSEEEQNYLIYDLTVRTYEKITIDSVKTAKEELKRLQKSMVSDSKDDITLGDERGSRKGKKYDEYGDTKKSRGRSRDDDEDLDLDEDDEDDRRSKKRSSKRDRDEDDTVDRDRSGKRSASHNRDDEDDRRPSRKRSRVEDDDEDDDEEDTRSRKRSGRDEDDDDEDDRGRSAKRRSKDEDEDDDDRGSRSSSSKRGKSEGSSGKKRRPVNADLDDF